MTDTDVIPAIQAELTANPDKYATLSDADVAQALNTKDPALITLQYVRVDTGTVRGILMAEQKWAAIGMGAQGIGFPVDMPTQQQLQMRGLCFTLYEAMCRLDTIAMEDERMRTATMTMLQQALAVGLIDQTVIDQLLGLAQLQVPQSWADAHVEGRYVSAEQVAAARVGA